MEAEEETSWRNATNIENKLLIRPSSKPLSTTTATYRMLTVSQDIEIELTTCPKPTKLNIKAVEWLVPVLQLDIQQSRRA